jgi:ubiquinone/menaquinone biosynthesis C-methylase UbiE
MEAIMKPRSFFLLFVPVGLALGLVAVVRSQGVDQGEVSRMVELLDVDPGEVFADVGAGDGRFSVALAKVVGENGTIYATEVDPNDLKKIEERIGSEKLANVDVVRGTQEGTGLPDRCCDGILLRRVYHHFQDPAAMQASLRRALRENGLLLVIDFGTRRQWSRPNGIPSSREGHGIDEEMLLSEMKKAGFELERELPWENGDYALLFRALPVPD